jgi:hypothetical protein
MSNIVDIGCITTLDLDPDRVLTNACGELSRVVIIGEREDGSEYFASSASDGGDVLWMMERAKLKLLRMADDT